MEDRILQKIISYFREEMTTSSSANSPGFSNASNPGGPVAGYDVPLKRNKKSIIIKRNMKKNWNKGED